MARCCGVALWMTSGGAGFSFAFLLDGVEAASAPDAPEIDNPADKAIARRKRFVHMWCTFELRVKSRVRLAVSISTTR